jgi:Zn-dependent protease with chaperone function
MKLSLTLALSSFFLLIGYVTSPADTTATAADTVLSESADTTAVTVEDESGLAITPERQEQLREYSRFVNIWRFASFFIGIATLSIIFLTGLSARFRDWAKKLKKRFFVIWGFFILFMIADYILGFPAAYYRSFVVEHQFGFSNQTFGQWLGEGLLALSLGLIFGIIPMWFFYWLINRTRKWWLWFSAGLVPLLVVVIVVAPVFISPLFNDFTPLDDKELEAKILTLADKAGIDGSDVFQMDGSKQSTKVNAYATGLFGTKRIVLYDTLIKNFTDKEVLFVMGHEIGHYVMNHLWWGLLVAVVFILFALWLVSRTISGALLKLSRWSKVKELGDVASLPLVMIFASVIGFVFQPITNVASRAMEWRADEYGMQISGVSVDDAASAFTKLSVLNLSDPEPHPLVEFWFYDHPALSRRIARLSSYVEVGMAGEEDRQ